MTLFEAELIGKTHLPSMHFNTRVKDEELSTQRGRTINTRPSGPRVTDVSDILDVPVIKGELSAQRGNNDQMHGKTDPLCET